MEPMFSPIITNAPIDTHDLTKNLLHCVDPDRVNPDMDYFPKICILVILCSGALPTIDTVKC